MQIYFMDLIRQDFKRKAVMDELNSGSQKEVTVSLPTGKTIKLEKEQETGEFIVDQTGLSKQEITTVEMLQCILK